MKPIRLHIEGMSCGGCVSRVESALSAVTGVADASVNLTTEVAVVQPKGDAAEGGSLSGGKLLEAVRSAGYDGYVLHAGKNQRSEEDRAHDEKLREHRQALVHALSTGVPIIALQYLAPFLTGGDTASLLWPAALQGILATVLLLSPAGAPLMVGGLRAAWFRTPNMDLLVSIGLTAAFLGSVWGLVAALVSMCHFHAVAMIVIFITLGRYIELSARRQAHKELSRVAGRLPQDVQRVTDEGTQTIRLMDVRVGDRLSVAAGSTIPVDGTVLSGKGRIDQRVMTGESRSFAVQPGDDVVSGASLHDGLLEIRADAVGRDSLMGKVSLAVERAQQGKTHWQRIADRFAGWLVPIVVSVALAAFLINLATGQSATVSLSRMIAVFVIACPCAMGLATPTAIMISSSVAARSGIFLREASAWERAAGIKCLLFDKTGTLTEDRLEIADVRLNAGEVGVGDKVEALRLMAAVERHVSHPVARAIVDAVSSESPLPAVEDFELEAGAGCAGTVDGKRVSVGSRSYMQSLGVAMDVDLEPGISADEPGSGDASLAVAFLAVDGALAARATFRESIRHDVTVTMQSLKDMGVASVMVTGDRSEPASQVAKAVGITDVQAERTPMQKLDAVAKYRARYGAVGFMGDGVNDAPSLAAADVGIAFASATEMAVGASDATILGHRVASVVTLIRQARNSVRVIRQNLFWAFGYNFAALPAAAFGYVPPGLAAGLMMFSSISVILNSLRLARMEDANGTCGRQEMVHSLEGGRNKDSAQ